MKEQVAVSGAAYLRRNSVARPMSRVLAIALGCTVVSTLTRSSEPGFATPLSSAIPTLAFSISFSPAGPSHRVIVLASSGASCWKKSKPQKNRAETHHATLLAAVVAAQAPPIAAPSMRG